MDKKEGWSFVWELFDKASNLFEKQEDWQSYILSQKDTILELGERFTKKIPYYIADVGKIRKDVLYTIDSIFIEDAKVNPKRYPNGIEVMLINPSKILCGLFSQYMNCEAPVMFLEKYNSFIMQYNDEIKENIEDIVSGCLGGINAENEISETLYEMSP